MRELMSEYLKNNDIRIKSGTDVNSIMRDMMSVLLEGALDEELDEELGYSKYDYRNKETDNSRNGHSVKTMHTDYGDMDIAIPRDRHGDYEPRLIKKYQNTVTQDMEEKILSMYAKGMTTADIESHMRELYDMDISDSTISRITDKILPIVKEWQERPLEEVYAVVFMDAIHYHVRSEGRIVKRAVYIALGIDMNGKKDILGMYVGENESAKFWLRRKGRAGNSWRFSPPRRRKSPGWLISLPRNFTGNPISIAFGQRGWNGQPDGRLVGSGISPLIGLSLGSSASRSGMELKSPTVYGCIGSV